MNKLKLCAYFFMGTFVGVCGYAFHYAKGTSYLSSDPKACVNCHIMHSYYDSWQKSSHHAVANCATCHLPHRGLSKWAAKMNNGLRHSWAFTIQNFPEPIRITSQNAKILTGNCKQCHASVVSQMVSFHKNAKENVNCLNCHSQVGHGATN